MAVRTHTDDALLSRSQWVRGAIGGALAAVLVYLTTVIGLLWPGLGVEPGPFLTGTLGDFYAAHPGAAPSITPGVRGVGPPRAVYALVVVGTLVWAGGRVAGGTQTADSPGAGMWRGTTVVAGYAPTAMVGLGLLSWLGTGFGGIEAVRTGLVAGIGYPLLFGAIGGFAQYSR